VTATSFVPPGYLTLRDAVDRTGHHCHGADWTGSEIQQLSDPKRPSDRLEAAVDELRGLLALGKINAVAVAENGKKFPVESSVWLAGNGRQVFDTGLLPVGNIRETLVARNQGTLWRQILVPEIQLQELLEKEIESPKIQRRATIKAETECRIWLVEMMNAGSPTKGKSTYQAEAIERFGVGSRAFIRAWANAIAESGNSEWSKPGRKS
jgi:hypothetical protein